MAKQQISVTRALVELKRYEDRLSTALANGTFSAVSHGEGDKIRIESLTKNQQLPSNVKDVETLISASFQKINQLIANRAAMKAAVIASNASTTIQFLGRVITVAEAIETKTSLQYLRKAYNHINAQVVNAANIVTVVESKLQNTIENLTAQALGGSGKSDAVTLEAIAKVQRAAYNPKVIGHDLAADALLKLQEQINAIEAELDFTLSESNAKTMIEVDL